MTTDLDTTAPVTDVEAPQDKYDKTEVSNMEIKAIVVPGKVALAALTPDLLSDLAFISTYSTRDEQSSSPKQHGYQRDPMAERFMGIGKYYAKNGNRHLIPPIIASVRVYSTREQKEFDALFNAGNIDGIHSRFGKSVVSIVDGQHRMGGLRWAWKNIEDFNTEVPVMLFYGLRYAEEATLFDDINTNQRKLPKALIEATKVHLEARDKSHAQKIREIAFSLAQDGDSVWQDKVNMTGERDSTRSITYEGLRRSTNSMFPDGLLGRLNARHLPAEMIAKKYWQMIAGACAVAWHDTPRLVEDESGESREERIQYRLKELSGVAAVSRLGYDILSTSLDRSSTEEEFLESMTDLVSRLSVVDWEKSKTNPWMMASQAGFAGQKGLYEILYNLVYLGSQPGVSAEEE